ncbi:MAG: SusC/RagA family TonB-linked outer membrane protein [Bacteroidales bacterium]
MMKKLPMRFIQKLSLLIGILLLTGYSIGQIKITGKVYSAADNQTIPGVSVQIKGTATSTITDLDGLFSLTAASTEDIIVISYLGYVTQETVIGTKTEFTFYLEPDMQNIDEVIVLGYSSKKKSEITSAVTTLSSDKLMDITSNDIGTMLQGKVAGIQVINSSGAPGSTSEIRVRGISSFSAPQGPLYVVDGIIGGTFDPNDVETVTVLKDAGATGMYGSQANGGVIVITTKKARSGQPQFEVKTVTGFRIADHGHANMMDSKTLYNYHREFFRDPVNYVIDDRKFKEARPESLIETNTDWQDECYNPGFVQNYYLSASGNSDKFNYYVGGSYYNEKGTFINTDYESINLRANTNYKFNNKVSLTNNINLRGSKNRGADYMNIYYSYTSMPWDNPYDENGNPRSFKTAEGIWSKDKINPIQAAENSELSSKGFSFDYDADLTINILEWLTFSSTNRIGAYTSMDQAYYAKNADNLTYFGTGFVSSQSNFAYSGITTNLLKFNFQNGKHSIGGLAGFEAQISKDDYIYGSGMGIPEGLRVPSVASSQYMISGAPSKSVMQSIITQANYNFAGKYFLSASFRVDQSSQFAPNKRTAMFPSVSAAWMVTNEDFFNKSSAVSNLKLKASWGKTGMKDIGPYRYMEMFSYSSQYDGQPAAVPTQMANPDLTWEQTSQLNAGFEMGLWKIINLELNFYHNLTKDLLVERALPPSGGFRTQWQNIGKDLNTGVELALGATILNKNDITWTIDASLSYNRNELSGFGADTIVTANSYGVYQIYHDGASLYTWYAKEYSGIDPADGSVLWINSNGEKTHEYQDARYVEYGSPMPKFQGGFATEFRFKAISLRANFSYLSDNKIFNYFRRYVDHDLQETQFNVMMPRDDYKLWQKPGDIATKPLPQNARNSFDPSTRFIDDGSFLKIRNITLSYELPKDLVSKLKLKGLNIAVSADNPFTCTNFWGQDPEVSIDPSYGNLPGYAEFKYPNNKQYLLTLNIRF